MNLRAYQLTIFARLSVLPLYHSYRFSDLPVLTPLPGLPFYQFGHFRALDGFTNFTARADFRPCRFNILPFRDPTGFTLLPILPIYRTCRFYIRIAFRPCLFLTFLPFPRPSGFTISTYFTDLSKLTRPRSITGANRKDRFPRLPRMGGRSIIAPY